MRISLTVPQMGRQLAEDYLIEEDNIVLPKGTNVGLSIYNILNDPAVYPNPERFLNIKYDMDTYMSFSRSSGVCARMNFGLIEQKIFLSLVLKNLELIIAKLTQIKNN
ncbi:hypothetical protein CONCODRAFT_2022 [Conidiobolus coronatus NRRL 28638]|uniref:Cytochrome P450 n=1 Tax=Conidiobolus coronatus (strain ATCC 28846 / CBS 209.66 / NRRL 28638) TaxID=796925 RepID=A0A137PIX6_CONC2|nr:hypothetical protein CONCODRAFT_2022 [Conidiobolus coronatus NRRL 28638]|eukprot:KXN74947.1 hypothetical protein CONCODRAFT_2022 [Conidiobolus coronatus NRRL 28638]